MDLLLKAETDDSSLTLILTLRPTDGDRGFSADAGYRALDWADVEALAAAQSVGIARDPDRWLRLSFPRVDSARG